MKLTTRHTSYGLEIKVDEVETDIFKNSNESNEMMQNLIEVLEDLSKLRDEDLFEYLERHFDKSNYIDWIDKEYAQLQADKEEMVRMLERCENRILPTENHSSLLRDLNELIQKMKE